MNVVSLFAGVGGFDLAAEAAGFTITAQVENDKFCQKVLAHHWPDIPQYGDIHDVDPTSLGTPDLLCGGFPCQDYSVAGKREGLAGDRGALWWQFHRLIDATRPTWVVGENVPGLLSSDKGRAFGTIVGSLVELGYGVVWRVLDAQYFGVAQRRRRVFIVGHLGGEPKPEVLALSEGSEGYPAPSRQPRQNLAPTLSSRTKGGGGLGTDTDLDGGLIPVANTLITPSGGLHIEDNYITVPFTQNTRDEVRDLGDIAGALSLQGTKQTNYIAQFSLEKKDYDTAKPLLHHGQRLDPEFESFVGVESKGVRRLTPLECERLQGFPDNWTDICSATQRYKQMGNALAVPVAAWIMRNIARV